MKIALSTIIILFVASLILAQDELAKFNSQLIENGQVAKFDEFGDLKESEIEPRFKRFEKYLKENKSYKGYVIFYGNLNDSVFKQSVFFADRKMHTLSSYISRYDINAPQINYIFGGLRGRIVFELWVSPTRQSPPITSYAEPPKNIKYKLELLAKQYLKLNENRNYDNLIKASEESQNLDSSKFHLEVVEYNDSKDSFEELAEVLSRDETWKAKLFFYLDNEMYDAQISRQIITSLLEPYMKNLKLDMNRVKIIYGGYRSTPETEIWVINKNGVEPEPMPDEKIEVKLND